LGAAATDVDRVYRRQRPAAVVQRSRMTLPRLADSGPGRCRPFDASLGRRGVLAARRGPRSNESSRRSRPRSGGRRSRSWPTIAALGDGRICPGPCDPGRCATCPTP
jgi:hypothetical protein